MKINRNNYEIFFLDYHEGNLTPAKVEELMIFVENNPDLKEEFESFEEINIPIDESIKFDLKKSLKKTSFINTKNINEENYEKFFIAFFEDDLNKNEKEELIDFIKKNPNLKSEFDLFGKTHLKADETVIYENKSSLKKHSFFLRKAVYYPIGIAASLLILFGIYFLMTPEKSNRQYAGNIPTKLPVINKSIQIENVEQVYPEKLAYSDVNNSIIVDYKRQEPQKINLTKISQIPQNTIIDVEYAYADFDIPLIIEARYEYALLYEDIKMAESIRNASNKNIDLANKTLPGKIISYAYNSIKNIFRKKIDPIIEDSKNNPALWVLAKASISGYNYLTDNDVHLKKKYDEEGKLESYCFKGENLKFNKKVKKK